MQTGPDDFFNTLFSPRYAPADTDALASGFREQAILKSLALPEFRGKVAENIPTPLRVHSSERDGSTIQAAAKKGPEERPLQSRPGALPMKLAHVALAAALALTPAALLAQAPHNINQRKENQQDRVAQGVKSGQLTPGETARLEHQERGIKAQDHGHLTRQDRRTLHHQQNVESHRIYRDKHNHRRG